MTRDSFPANNQLPITLNRYLFANANPAAFTDPSGQISLQEVQTVLGIIATDLAAFTSQVTATLMAIEATLASITTIRIARAAIGVFAAVNAGGARVGFGSQVISGRFFGEEAMLSIAGSGQIGIAGSLEAEVGLGIDPGVVILNINQMGQISIMGGLDVRIFPRRSQFTVAPTEAFELFEMIAQANVELRSARNLSTGMRTAGAGLGFNALRSLFTLGIPLGSVNLT